jgi:2-(1,2-epoxy-1,2-dihydrophenyl)acetyl-CoA isomerase
MANAPQPAQTANGPLVLESLDGAVLTLTLNRPERLNALDPNLATALVDALIRAEENLDVRAIVLTGAGRGFCSGGDLVLLQDARARKAPAELEGLLRAGSEIVLKITQMPKPVLAAVNGPAAGAGMNLALACDLRVASDYSSFAQSFAKVGLVPDFGGTWLLPRLVGPARAAELFITAATLSAGDAEKLGIVNRVVPHDTLMTQAVAMAGQLAEAPPLVVAAIKKALHGRHVEEIRRALDQEAALQAECFQSEDCAEGLNAFFEKRPPVFKGR